MDVRNIVITELLDHLKLGTELSTLDINEKFSLAFNENIFTVEWYENSFRLIMYYTSGNANDDQEKFSSNRIENILQKINPEETQPFLVDIGSSQAYPVILSIELGLYGRADNEISEAFDVIWKLSETI
ncbi:MAG: hypothetical protein V4629_10820 [Pseudomonadota bacterium]